MLIDNDSLYLYNLSLKDPSSFQFSIVGQFVGQKKSQEIVVVNSTLIEIWRPDSTTGKLKKLFRQKAFGIIQSVDKVRSVGSQKDFLVITSDSGTLVVAEFDESKGQFKPVVQEPHSKNGLRRLTPGEYLAVDPYNRAILISAIEKNKLVYKVQSGNDNKFELSSPLESSTRMMVTLKLTSLDTDFENPKFAAIECDYGYYANSKDKYNPNITPLELNYYELDQGLNYLVKSKSEEKIPPSASHLIPLPGHIGGLLVVCDDLLLYDDPRRKRIYLPLPLREGAAKTTINAFFLHKLKRNNFFILLQSTLGDLFKLEVEFDDEEEEIKNMTVFYFDTIPLCNSINVLKNGFLFANVYNNNKLLYQFENLEASSEDKVLNSEKFQGLDSILTLTSHAKSFNLHGLKNLSLIDVLESIDPVTKCSLIEVQSKDIPDPIKKIVTLSSHSYVKTLTHGVKSSLIVESPVRISPTGIFATKLFKSSTNDQYLVVTSSLSSSTLVLSIGEVVEEEEDSRFVLDQATIAVQQVGVSSVVQIHTNGIRHIRHFQNGGNLSQKTSDWFPPAGISIVKASANNQQVIIGLSNREICYFEIDPSDDQLVEYQDKIEMSGIITALSIGQTDSRCPFAMVGLSDETVQAVSLLQHNCLETISLQAVSAKTTSLVVQSQENLSMVHIGLENGLYVRSTVDSFTGKLSNTRVQYIGSQPVKLHMMKLDGADAILAISSRPWIGYYHEGSFKAMPLLDINISSGSSFFSEDIGGEGIVGISKNNLVIFTVGDDEIGFNKNESFSYEKIRLRYTPRRMELYKQNIGFISQSEYNTLGPFPKHNFQQIDNEDKSKNLDDKEVDQDYYEAFGYQRLEKSWASCVQAVDLSSNKIIQSIELPSNENITSSCIVTLEKKQEYLVLGVTQGQTFLPNRVSKSFIHTFKISSGGTLTYVHKTEVDNVPSSMLSFNNMVLVGMGNFLRLYSLGQRQLLRKCSSNIDFVNNIVELEKQNENRIVVGDSDNSTVFVSYDSQSNIFIPISNDTVKRKITSLKRLDDDTVIGGDKFGNVFVSRLPSSVSKESAEGWSQFKDPYLNASPSRLKNICEFYLHDIPTSFIIGSLNVGGSESIIYSGLQGTIGMLIPIMSKQEVEFLCGLEFLLRKLHDVNFDDFDADKKAANLLGKDHLKFRSYYNPSKNVIDGDFIEQYIWLTPSLKIRIANELDRSPKEIEKKIAEMRNRSAF